MIVIIIVVVVIGSIVVVIVVVVIIIIIIIIIVIIIIIIIVFIIIISIIVISSSSSLLLLLLSLLQKNIRSFGRLNFKISKMVNITLALCRFNLQFAQKYYKDCLKCGVQPNYGIITMIKINGLID